MDRRRGEKENNYEYDSGKSAGTLEALRGDVPTEIQHLVNMADYNIQSQHDRYFLLENTSGEVARMLNDLVGLDVIDRTVAKIEKITRQAKTKYTQSEDTITELEEELKEFDNLPQIEKLVVVLETLLEERDLKRRKRKDLASIVVKYQELDEEVRLCNARLELEKDSKEFFKDASLMADEVKTRDYLLDKIEQLEIFDEGIKKLDCEIQPSAELDSLVNEIQTYKKEVSVSNEVQHLVDRVDGLDADIVHAGEGLVTLGKELGEALMELGECPFCFSSIDSNVVASIVKELGGSS